jgi:hypothetical protein
LLFVVVSLRTGLLSSRKLHIAPASLSPVLDSFARCRRQVMALLNDGPSPPAPSPQQGGLNAEAWAEGQGYAGQRCPG